MTAGETNWMILGCQPYSKQNVIHWLLTFSIYQTLCFVKDQIEEGELAELKKQAEARLIEKGFKVDYVEIADAANLKIINHWDGKQKLVALAAAFLNQVRLIDNIIMN